MGQFFGETDDIQIIRPMVAHDILSSDKVFHGIQVRIEQIKLIRLIIDLLQLQLFDYLGRRIRTESWRSDRHVLQRKGLPNGVYYFTVTGEKGLLSEGKLIMN